MLQLFGSQFSIIDFRGAGTHVHITLMYGAAGAPLDARQRSRRTSSATWVMGVKDGRGKGSSNFRMNKVGT